MDIPVDSPRLPFPAVLPKQYQGQGKGQHRLDITA
jgi:hypothetical protein